jgi:hypothetical protein
MDESANALDVYIPASLGYVMGVADLIAELGPSSTNFTNFCHFNRLLGANPQDSTGAALTVGDAVEGVRKIVGT